MSSSYINIINIQGYVILSVHDNQSEIPGGYEYPIDIHIRQNDRTISMKGFGTSSIFIKIKLHHIIWGTP